MLDIEAVKLILGGNAVSVLIVLLFFFLARDRFDDRYELKKDVPDEKCYGAFTTKDMCEQKEKLNDIKYQKIEESFMEIKKLMYKIFYRDVENDSGK